MMKMKTMIAATGLALLASMATAASVSRNSAGVLADEAGMTLYIFDKDSKGVSNCYDDCAEAWPPFFAAAGAAADGDFTLVERKDGKMQWAFGGMPLYYWAGDSAPGDTSGDGVGGVWHVVK
ncbi:COG4315 family predicted lipoprotein [Algicella marina]|uniref:Lipoprotein with Yx(FWY)xxD motif n=1 Tax=Algicella marina TaxID=2683284 RepID=A0A6P1T0J4_9RHOB|nr:hypothetical protein [Algicella marina]QHQ35163.1 hypothetical protein GO499_08105 [Algicella marina]